MKLNTLKTIGRFAGAAILAMAALLPVRATTNYPNTVLSYGPVAYWRFTDNNPGPALNIVTNYGSIGAAGNGYEVGPVVANAVPGIIGTAIQFSDPYAASPDDLDGVETLSVQTKIDVPYNATINSQPPFSIEFWFDVTTLSSDVNGDCLIESMDTIGGGQANRSGWLFYLGSAGNLQWRLGNTAGYAGSLTTTNNFATVGNWEHVAATWDGTNAIVYVNGTVAAAAPVSAANYVQNSESFLRFGATALGGYGYTAFEEGDNNGGQRGYDGYLEQVAIYTNILSPATVLAHYQATNLSVAAYASLILSNHPVAYWPMQEPAVTVPDPSTYPTVQNFGYDGDAAEGTNQWGSIQGQAGPGYAGFGTASNAFFFDGVNGYVEIAADPGLVFATDTNEFGPGASTVTNQITMMAWVKPVADDYYRVIMEQGWDSSSYYESETFLRISTTPGSGTAGEHFYEVGMVDGNNDFEDIVLAPIPPGDVGNWVFLVGTFDGTNWNLYRDGQPVGTPHSYELVLDPSGEYYDFDELPVTPQGTGPITVYENWTIGSRADDPNIFYTYLPDVVNYGQLFDGYIAEPAIFTNSLTPAQVYQVYASAQVPPVITTALTNPGTVYLGSSVSFSIGADGVTNIGYLWESNGVSTGDTTTNYSFTPAAAGTYTVSVVVTNAYGTNTPSVTFQVLDAPPVITTQPAPEEKRFIGFPFTFTVAATGTTPFTYYWKLGSTVVQAGSSPTYTGTASLANAGTYTVTVSNASGINAVSSNALLVVYSIPAEFAGEALSNSPPPIAYWRLDETNGNTAYDYINGNNGTYFNATQGVSGYSGVDPDDLAAAFSGTNSYVGNISGTAINFAGTNNSFTIEAWVNAQPGQPDQSTIIAKGIGNNGTTETEQFALDVFQNFYRFFTFSGRANATPTQALATQGPNGFWQHVAGVYDAVGETLTIYVNGVEEAQTPYTLPINSTVSPISIGSKRSGNNPAYDSTFDGSIDNVAIFSTALSSAQVLAAYNSAYGTALSPSITIQPVGVTNFAGITTELSVTAQGSPTLTYQWYHNGSAVPGATYATLTNSPTTYADAGTYYVTVGNPISATNSISVPLVVLAPPTNPPIIPGLVMHLTFNSNLVDTTGRGNNGVGQHTTLNPALINTNLNSLANGYSNAVTVAASPDPSGGITNSAFYYTSGVTGGALLYSTVATKYSGGPNSGQGIGTNDYYVRIGHKPDLQFGTNDFTVAYWIKIPPQNWNPGIQGDNGYFQGGDLPFFTDALQSTGGNGYVFAPAYGYGTVDPENGGAGSVTPAYPGGWAVSIYGGGAGLRYYGNYFTGLINDGNWHSLIHVFSRTQDYVITYLDGAVGAYDKVDGTDLAAAGNINVTNDACIGQDPTGFYGETCETFIGDLGVWKRALTPTEAGAIYVAAVSNQVSYTTPVTLTYYPTNTTQFAVAWPAGVAPSSNYLQAASNPLGAFTNVTGATSPYVFSPSGSQKYFRIAQTNVYVIP